MLSVVVLSYNTQDTTIKCLEHLMASKGIELEVIVIDNASSDGSAEAIRMTFPKVKLIANKENIGFARGNNQGIHRTHGDKVLLLNSDCFVEPNTLAKCYKLDVDVVGCKLLNSDGSVQPSWGYLLSLRRIFMLMSFVDNLPVIRRFADSVHVRDLGRYTKKQEVDWITGAFMMFRKKIFEEIGGIDENYFMYGEEMEWMYRIKKAGYKVYFYPEAWATHLQGVSTKSRAKMFLSEMKGYLYWFKKHNPVWQQKVLSWVLIGGCIIRIPAWTVMGRWGLAQDYITVLPLLAREVFGPSGR